MIKKWVNVLNLIGNRIMDLYDKRILEILRQNSRVSYTEISRELGISKGTVRRRVNQLVENQVILKFTIEVKGSIAQSG